MEEEFMGVPELATLHLRGLAHWIMEDLELMFWTQGELISTKIESSQQGGERYAFLTLRYRREADKAMSTLQKAKIYGQEIFIHWRLEEGEKVEE